MGLGQCTLTLPTGARPLPHMQSEMNRKRLRQLYSVAQMEVKRQATKAKLEEVDKDIVKWLQVMQVGHHAEGHGLG